MYIGGEIYIILLDWFMLYVGYSEKVYMGRDVLFREVVEGCFRSEKRILHQFSPEWSAGNCFRWMGYE